MKIGDKVKVQRNMHFLHPHEFPNQTGTVKSILSNDRDVIVRFPTTEMSLEKRMLDTVKKAAVKWKFESRSYLDIDIALIYAELTHKNPLALIDIPDNCGVLVHQTLLAKASVCWLPNPLGERFTLEELKEKKDYPIYECEIEDFADWIAWAKVVKGSEWPKEYRDKVTVKVTLPNLS